ncbi:PaaX family transcriptional regulator C-terminal domain-containing protein [Shimia abyssi]|uniref:PaaX family transcriptional regulator n=1 Tax=Shimia abyssi TaxID=1662395 RepID=A0A2P8F8K3_9RHOB|nr:PaaX family transcriptional regulator C-terminal domain-containing protein [Shimia abyssi]PSL18039.1 PaaX family transcriptional regulator [Shimia abyssi]
MQDVDLHKNIQRVADCGPIRVWSLVVTIMGDLCLSKDDYLPGRTLNQIVSRLGINNQALRVALHRLRRDGWIRSERDGRASNYFLSDQGHVMSNAVRTRIYRSEFAPEIPLALAVASPQMSSADFTCLLPDDAVLLSSKTALIRQSTDGLDDVLTQPFSARNLPDWVLAALAPTGLQRDLAALDNIVRKTLKSPNPTTIIDQCTLRLIILHHWRRLCLRQPELGEHLLPSDWPGRPARYSVMQALAKLPRPDLARLCAETTD